MGLYLLSRTEVRNYSKWRETFDSEASAHHNAGLHLRHIWLDTLDYSMGYEVVYYLFEVEDKKNALAFLNSPERQIQAKKSGVVMSEHHFVKGENLY